MRAAGLIVAVAAVAGCAHQPVDDPTARAAFVAIEERLLDAAVLRIDYAVEARGAVAASLTGDLLLQTPGRAAIAARGEFAGAAVAPVLVADGVRMRGGTATQRFEQPLPADLRGGLLQGLTRMGVLHNLAMLAGGGAPDGTAGDVREWVEPHNFAWRDESRRIAGQAVRGIAFDLRVGGEPKGEAVLWFDPATGLPVARDQVVHFASGAMRVSERYTIASGGIVGPCRFDLDSVPAG